jgi:hypothetical protein
MNIITFNYKKADGKVSTRCISPVVVPSEFYEGTDLSELSSEDQVLYVQALGKLQDEFYTKMHILQSEFDLNNRYRRFDPSKMTNIIKEAV